LFCKVDCDTLVSKSVKSNFASYTFGSSCPFSPPCCGSFLGSAASFTGFARVYPRAVATSGLPFLFLETQVGTLGTPAEPSCFVHIKVDF